MLSEFNSLPGIYTYKDDGNLRVLETIPGEVTVVIGTAPDGPIGKVYLVTDTGAAERVFDPSLTKTGTLLQGMYEAVEAGAKYVALFRAGASPIAIDFLNGKTLIVNDAASNAGSKYKLYYTNANGTEICRVYDAITGAILFDSFAGINNGQFTFFGTQLNDSSTAVVIGDTTSAASPLFSALGDFTNASYSFAPATPYALTLVAGKEATTEATCFKAGQILAITGTDVDNSGSYLIDYVTLTGTTYTIYFKSKLTYAAGVVTENTSFLFDTVTSAVASAKIALKYLAPSNGLSLTLNQTFAAYARAYWELETAQVDAVVPAGVYFNEANVVDNEGKYTAAQSGYTAPTESDYLGKAYEFTHEGQLFFAFKNTFSTTMDKTATILPSAYELGIDGFGAKAWAEGNFAFDTAIGCGSQADIDALTEDIAYDETNFGYQLASFLEGLSRNETEASGAISMKPPKNYSQAEVFKWLGAKPTLDTNGAMIRSGSGVLGYKLMTGSLGVIEGLFKTSNGYLSGTAVLDRNNMKVDIGQYIDVIAMPVTIKSSYKGGSVGYVGAAASVYMGLLMSLNPNVSATNKKFKSYIQLPFTLKKTYLDQLTKHKYVAFTQTATNLTKIIDAPTAALSTSDYNRRSVCRVAAATVDLVRSIVDPYIGTMTNSIILKNLQDEVNNRLKDLASPEIGWLKGGACDLGQTVAMSIRGEAVMKLSLVTANELRRLTIFQNLRK